MSLLVVEDLYARYGSIQALHGISFHVDSGESVAILGSNGAGKTTTLRAITGMVRTTGRVTFAGKDITHAKTESIVRRGVAHVPQGRGTFARETVENNLRAAAYLRRDRSIKDDIEHCYEMFPRLKERYRQVAGSLSGGEQQMLAIARALMLRPRLLLLDEPSLGLAPLIIADVFHILAQLKKDLGVTMLLVEQNANVALDLVDHVFIMEAGTIIADGTADSIRTDDSIERSYLGF